MITQIRHFIVTRVSSALQVLDYMDSNWTIWIVIELY